jgi:adenosylcobinamide-phosphate synthase
MALGLALLAALMELAAGYPDRLFRRIGHPVTWLGALIDRMDRAWNTPAAGARALQARGIAAVAVLGLVSLAAGLGVQALAWLADLALPGLGLAVLAVLCSSLIAQRSLYEHVAAVAHALESEGLEAGRRAVSRIVGRDPDRLDEAGVARAAIESLAENFSDGVVAPLFWLALLGPAGAIGYKAVNTADSMIGHRTERHLHFGRAAARLDDWINLPASRLSAGLIALAALGLRRTVAPGGARAALRVVRRDARRHRSPNAGWPEAAMAGALGVSLAGPRVYHGVATTDPEMNAGARRALTAADIRRALRLYCLADAALIGLLALGWLALGRTG